MLGLGSVTSNAAITPSPPTINSNPLPVVNISRIYGVRFENLAIRENGQILATTASPNASIYQFDPLSILPPTILYTIPNITSALGITEGEPDIFYVASGDVDATNPSDITPSSYKIHELDVRNVSVLPGGVLTQPPSVQEVASLTGAALPNGIALAGPCSKNLLVADTFRGLIWNVNVTSGEVGVALNNTATKGGVENPSGVNGIKVWNKTLYWDSTGTNTLWKIPVSEDGYVDPKDWPVLIGQNITCDDFVLDAEGTAYVAGPFDVVTQLNTDGTAEIITGTWNSTSSSIMGPTALRFGRMASDRWSLYVTSNGGIFNNVESGCGLSRIDLGANVTAALQ